MEMTSTSCKIDRKPLRHGTYLLMSFIINEWNPGIFRRLAGTPLRHDDKLGTGWIAAIEARDAAGNMVSRVNAAVTGCEPNQHGPKLGRMFILNGKTNYWSPSGDQVLDLLANAVCAVRPKLQ